MPIGLQAPGSLTHHPEAVDGFALGPQTSANVSRQLPRGVTVEGRRLRQRQLLLAVLLLKLLQPPTPIPPDRAVPLESVAAAGGPTLSLHHGPVHGNEGP